jgi:purine-cytosine permease-like protein
MRGVVKRVVSAPMFSPAGLAVRGAVFLCLLLICHCAGWREYTTVLCGTSPTGNVTDKAALYRGIVYVLTYFGALILTPVLLIASGLVALWQCLSRMRES